MSLLFCKPSEQTILSYSVCILMAEATLCGLRFLNCYCVKLIQKLIAKN